MFEKRDYNKPSWLNRVDRVIFNLIRPVFNISFSIDGKFPFNPRNFKDQDDIDLHSWDEDGGSPFLYELPNETSEFRIYEINDQYAITALNPHVFGEIAHLYDISKIVKFDIQSTNVIDFVSPDLFQPIKENLSAIEFDDSYLTDIHQGMFRDLHLKHLSFYNCRFGHLSEDFGLDGIGSLEELVLYDNIYLNNIDIRPQLKSLEKSGTDVVFKSPLDAKDKALQDKLDRIFPFEL